MKYKFIVLEEGQQEEEKDERETERWRQQGCHGRREKGKEQEEEGTSSGRSHVRPP